MNYLFIVLAEMQRKVPGSTKNILVMASMGLLITLVVLLFVPLEKPWPKVLEGTLYLQCLLLLANYPPLRQMFVSIPKKQKWAVLCFGGILLFTQLKDRPQQTFPFIPWNMYHGRYPKPPKYLEYIGICSDGHELVIPIGGVFASQHRTVLWRLDMLWKQIEDEPIESIREKNDELYKSLLKAIVLRYNEQHPDTVVIRVRVNECTMPRPAPGIKLEVSRRLLNEYPIS